MSKCAHCAIAELLREENPAGDASFAIAALSAVVGDVIFDAPERIRPDAIRHFARMVERRVAYLQSGNDGDDPHIAAVAH
jgi:hypothetical protein